ncbi:hypothetical protein ACFE04_031798 [Oxalis oulophora]
MSTKVHEDMEMATNQVTGQMQGKKLRAFVEKMKKFPVRLWKMIWQVGKDDPRRVIHAFKVGTSLTLVSLLYLMDVSFKGIGQSAIWAVMTVVVVLEFTAGATLCKGLNRGLGTLLAGSLAFFIEYIANDTGHIFRAVFIGSSVFFVGFASTYVRFIPKIKKNYDYGVLIFLLTFNLITVSSYRVENVMKIAHERFYTIAIGCAVCLAMSLFIFPNWSGEELHKNTVAKLEGLARSIEACINEYFNAVENETTTTESTEDETIYKGYKAVLDSKSIDEMLASHASWEPRHWRHCKYPWKQYVKVGAVLRQFGYSVVALHGCLQTEIQTPKSVRRMFKSPCTRLASEVTKALIELANSIKNHRHCSPEILSDHLHEALQDLNTAIKSQPRLFLGSRSHHSRKMLALAAAHAQKQNEVSISSVKTDSSALHDWKYKRSHHEKETKVLRPQLSKIASLEFSEALPFAAFASLLVEIVARLDNVIEEVEELGSIACFKEFVAGRNDDHIVDMTKVNSDTTNNYIPTDGAD